MIIRVEPKDFFMYAVYLIFSDEQADSEDDAVRNYLAEHKLVPKHQDKTIYEGLNCEALYFGGCYMGRHLGAIRDIQSKVVGRELISEHVEQLLLSEPHQEVQAVKARLASEQLTVLLANLVEEFQQESPFGTDEEGHLKLTLDDARVQSRFLELASTL